MKKKSKSITPTKLLNHSGLNGGADGDRTHDLLTARYPQPLARTESHGLMLRTVAQNRAFQPQIRNPDATNFGLRKSG